MRSHRALPGGWMIPNSVPARTTTLGPVVVRDQPVRDQPGSRPPRGRSTRPPTESWLGYLFVLPQTIGFIVFALAPLIGVFWLSFHRWDFLRGEVSYVGLANFQRLFADPDLPSVLVNTTFFVGAYVPLNVGFGLLLALAANRAVRASPLLRTLYFAPVLVSLVAWTLVFKFILQDDGLLNSLLRSFSLDPPNWLREQGWALAAVVVVQVLKTTGLAMVIFLAGLQDIPSPLLEAARVDGASEFKLIRWVTLPLLTPYVFLVVVISIISSFKSFALIDLLTGGGPGTATSVFSYYIYEQGFQRFDMGYASVLAVLLFGLVLAITGVQFVVRRRWVFSE